MKLENTEPTRKDITITFTPEEQDILISLVGNISGNGKARKVTSELYAILKRSGAEYYDDLFSPDIGSYGD